MNELVADTPAPKASKLTAYENYYSTVGLTDYATVFAHNDQKEVEASLCASRIQLSRDFSAREIRVLDIGCGLGTFTCQLLELLYKNAPKDQPKPRVICDLIDINPTAFELFARSAADLEHCAVAVERKLCLPWQDVTLSQLAASYDLVISNHTFYGCQWDHNLAQSLVTLLAPNGFGLVALESSDSDLARMRQEANIPHNCAEDFELALNAVFCNYCRVLYDCKFRFDLADPVFLNWCFAGGDIPWAERHRLISKYALRDTLSTYIAIRAAVHIVEPHIR